MHEKYGEALLAGLAFVPIANALFEKTVAEPPSKVLRFLAKMVVNSNGAVLSLVVYGYGNDATSPTSAPLTNGTPCEYFSGSWIARRGRCPPVRRRARPTAED